MIQYTEHQASSNLAPIILSYWQFIYTTETMEPLQHTILPDGCTSIVWMNNSHYHFSEILLFGPQKKYVQVNVPANTHYLGIRLFPTMVEPLLGVSPLEIRDQSVPITQLDGLKIDLKAMKKLSFELDALDKFCEKHFLSNELELDHPITEAVRIIQEKKGNVRMHELAEQQYLSERQFQRRFRSGTGLSPKNFAQIQRFRNALIELYLENQSYQDVVFDNGYFDQSHFLKDFYRLLEQSPETFKYYIHQIEHIFPIPAD